MDCPVCQETHDKKYNEEVDDAHSKLSDKELEKKLKSIKRGKTECILVMCDKKMEWWCPRSDLIDKKKGIWSESHFSTPHRKK